MFDAELEDAVVYLAVTQRPFETESVNGIVNAFSSLKPVLHEDGRLARMEEFPDDGYVWWMLRSGTRTLAEPGRLLSGALEQAERAGIPGKSWYQVQVDSIEPVRPEMLTEVLSLQPNWIARPEEILNRERVLQLDHHPLSQVYVSWQGHLYGPFTTATEPVGESGKYKVQLATPAQDPAVMKIPEQALQMVPVNRNHHVRVEVSLVRQPPTKTSSTQMCLYHLIPTRDFRRAIGSNVTRVVLESDEAIIKRVAKNVLTRGKKQELSRLLDELTPLIDGSTEAGAADASRAMKALKDRLHEEERAADELATALLTSGVLEKPLQQAIEREAQQHVEKNAARLQTEIDAKLEQGRKELDALEKSKELARQELETIRREGKAIAEKEQAQARERFERECRAREEELDARHQELLRQGELLRGSLTQVSRELASNREGLVKQFLTIVPLLQQLDLLGQRPNGAVTVAASVGPAGHALQVSPHQEEREQTPSQPFALPAFVVGGKNPGEITEVQFFERFCKHVEDSGFKHRRLDLAAFHLSVKCNDLTILGGQPGTGKSSLPRLYAEALAGDEYDEGMQRYLHVGVSPSWLDLRDLLGHTNALDHRFQPAECGLYQLLIWAQEEDARRGLASRLYVVCMDEMNLAQVEHYFSGFIQALERPPGQREVRCFSPELVSASDPFAPWPVLKLPRSVRFVGTVNFDETTRQLSQRVLDRANLIRLHPLYLLDAREVGVVRPSGVPVALRHYRDWVVPSAGLERPLAEMLDRLKEPLSRLGCPLNQRRFSSIRKLLGNTPAEICTPEEALDLQIAQRILPQVRNLFRPGARQALESLRKVLRAHPSGFPDSLQLLDEIQASEFSDDLFSEGAEQD